MVKDLSDDVLLLNDRNHPHRAPTFGTGERVHFIDLLDQPCLVLPLLP